MAPCHAKVSIAVATQGFGAAAYSFQKRKHRKTGKPVGRPKGTSVGAYAAGQRYAAEARVYQAAGRAKKRAATATKFARSVQGLGGEGGRLVLKHKTRRCGG